MSNKGTSHLLEHYGFSQNFCSSEPFLESTLKLAANICKTPIAYISIVDDKKCYIIDQYGSKFQTIEREESICQYTVEQKDILIVNDTSKNKRTNTLDVTKGNNGIVFYAGFPLLLEDQNVIGTLCVTNDKASNLDEDQKCNLEILANQVVGFLKMRRSTIKALNEQGISPNEKHNTVNQLIQELEDSSIHLNASNSKLKSKIEEFQIKNKELITLIDEFPGAFSILNKEYRYTFTNKRYEELSSLTHHQIVGMHVSEIFGQEYFEQNKSLYDRVLNGEKISIGRFYDTESWKKYINVNYCPAYREDGQIVGIYIFSKDMTDIKSYQSQLENSNENLENFAHMVCHDLQSPLRTISSFGELLEKDLKKKNVVYNNRNLEIITQSARQSSKLVSDLLQFAKVGNENFEMQEVSFADVCDNVLLNLFEQIQNEKANVELPENDLMLFGFRTDFVILLQNFISNAIKYRNPELAPQISVQTTQTEGGVEIVISDNGLGIPEDKIEKIFDPFTRLAMHSHIQGTGIGLATCCKILKKYKSTIRVKSILGEGSQFSFFVPKAMIVENDN